MGPLGWLTEYVKQRTQPVRDTALESVAPDYAEFLNNSGISEIDLPRAVRATYRGIVDEPPAFGPHAVITERVKDRLSKQYPHSPKYKAVKGLLGGRDYGRRLPAKDVEMMKDQAVLYQFLQGMQGLDFEGDTIDALYNKYGIDLAAGENNSIPSLNENDFEGFENLIDEYHQMMR